MPHSDPPWSTADVAAAGRDEAPGARLALFGAPGLVAMAGAVVLGAWYGQAGVVLLAGLVLATGLVARGWAFLSLVGLHYQASLAAHRAFPGDIVRLQASLDNRKPLPLSWVEAEVSLPEALAPDDPLIGAADAQGRRPLRFATPLGAYRKVTLIRDLECRRRGYYRIGPAHLRSSDIFGLFLKSRAAAGADTLVIYPKLYAMSDLGLPARQPLGSSRDPQRLFEDPARPMGLRPYTPETPLKAVAWKATARSGELQAKQYEPTVTLATALFLAVDTFAAPGDDDVFEWAVSAVASLATRDLDLRRPVGVFANGKQADGNGAVVLPPGRAPDQQTLILEHLARIERSPSGAFGAFLDANLARSAVRATLVVIGGRFTDEVLSRLRDQRQRGRPVVLLVAGDAPLPKGPLPCRRVGTPTEPAAA